MKVKMLELVQGRDITGTLLHDGLEVSILELDEEYQVSDTLGAWLLEHRKAVKLETAAHYGAQAEPELRDDEEIYKRLAEASADEEQGEPIANTQAEPKRTKRGRK